MLAEWHHAMASSAPHRLPPALSPALRCCTASQRGPGAGVHKQNGPAATCGPVQQSSEHLASALRASAPDPTVWVVCLRGLQTTDLMPGTPSMPAAVAAVADARRRCGATGVTGEWRRQAADGDETPAAGDAPALQPCARGSGRRRLRVRKARRPCTRPAAHWPGLRLLQADGCRAEPPPPAKSTKSISVLSHLLIRGRQCRCLFVPDACLCPPCVLTATTNGRHVPTLTTERPTTTPTAALPCLPCACLPVPASDPAPTPVDPLPRTAALTRP
jgi:hypothetical protein